MRTRITGLAVLVLLVSSLVYFAWQTSPVCVPHAALGPAGSVTPSRSDAPGRPALEPRRRADATAAAIGFYGAPAGARMSYRFRHQTSYRLEVLAQAGDPPAETPSETMSIPFRGTLHMQILERDRDVVTVLVQGTGIEAPVRGEIDGRGAASLRSCREALETWFLVRIDRRGTVGGYAFQQGRTPDQRNFARAVLAGFFHTIPETPTPTWAASESDATGGYDADYRLLSHDEEATEIERTKRSYTTIGRQPEPPEHALSGHSRAVFGAAVAWISSVRIEEALAMDIHEFPGRVHVAIDARFDRIDADWPGVDIDSSAWPPFVAASGADEDLAATAMAGEREQWRQKTAAISLDELLASIRMMVEAGDTRSTDFYAAWELLHWKLALEPKTVAAAESLLLTRSLDEGTGAMLLSALGKAGTSPAQAALLSVYGASHLAGSWREAATFSMFQLADPDAGVLQAVAERVGDLRHVGSLDAASVLLLGTLAPRQAKPLANGRTALASLLAMEGRARDLGASGLWLDALGNAAVPAVAPFAARYVKDDDPLVRESAIAALDHSSAQGIAPALIAAAEADPVRAVRLRAIEALGRRASPAARESLRRLANDAEDVAVRRAAVAAIAARERLDPADRQVLARLAQQDPSEDLRAAARRVLAR